ncbi:class I SAM-dependent methyltransferase [Roseisalinus antarcticus]|uniref:Putative S-adenosylmethionine-dependent methyltransferase/MSMEI_2290 n=1 Tax=Roseisalinus antarcticus TaxID=254357 RepID=A0A1Y5U0D2_9RHOB|nr:class I SAM-dependent methyltransferase [Roseisalinus antarcticus]SLN77837.1 putative S-adenosylmethionine-dependent methyltransferase/MSMEI_2290 [Roseisalinus antarcticus]
MNKSPPEFSYSGVDNLEVMLEAKQYNRFLTDQVLKNRIGKSAILDFGAGIGTFSTMVRDRGVQVDCLEVDAHQCEILQSKGFRVFSSSDAIADSSYDYIFSLNVFEHIEDDIAAMKECARILRPSGVVYTYVPAFPILFGDMDRKVQHYRRYTRASLRAVSEEAGLKVTRTAYVDIAGFFASLLYNATSKGSGDIHRKPIELYDRFIFPVSRVIDYATNPFIGKNVFSVAHKTGVQR